MIYYVLENGHPYYYLSADDYNKISGMLTTLDNPVITEFVNSFQEKLSAQKPGYYSELGSPDSDVWDAFEEAGISLEQVTYIKSTQASKGL